MNLWMGVYNTWTLDWTGLDRGLDTGLDHRFTDLLTLINLKLGYQTTYLIPKFYLMDTQSIEKIEDLEVVVLCWLLRIAYLVVNCKVLQT